MEQIERIQHFEMLLDRVAPVLGNLEDALEAFDGIQDDVKELSAYYESDEWRDDFEADEAGKLPKDRNSSGTASPAYRCVCCPSLVNPNRPQGSPNAPALSRAFPGSKSEISPLRFAPVEMTGGEPSFRA